MNDERWHQVSRIYNDAAALAPSDRAAFLHKACGADDALRAEVDSLLVDDSRAERLLEPNVPGLGTRDLGLEIGKRIGVYQITSLLGVGGMGEVYRARDTKLGRDVAIKVLPPAFTSDPDRLARFEREARLLATLNHPHIGAIHGLEDGSGIPALVLELVEGETLAERLAKGPIPISEALTIARQIAEALEAADEAGIVHRDLKPANIKVTSDGSVKVLDFGLAKITQAAGSAGQTSGLSHDGLIVGTVAYMSPEQARGKAVDKRVDIWAFGCVLFEMLTGRPAFPGETISDTLAAILEHDPDWKALPAATPHSVLHLLHRCLEKDARQRLRDIGDAREDLTATPSKAGPPEAPPKNQRVFRIVAASVVSAAIAAGVSWRIYSSSSAESSAPVARFSLTLPSVALPTNVAQRVAISRDGRFVVYIGDRDGVRRLYVRQLDQLDSIPILGTERDVATMGYIGGLFVSPDGKWVGYNDQRVRELKKIPVGGGAPVTIMSRAARGPASWGRDGTIIFSDRSGLMKVAETGGVPEPLTKAPSDTLHSQPHILPDGKAVLFTIDALTTEPVAAKPPMLAVLSLETDEQKVLLEGSYARATTNGHIVFLRDGALWAVRFDAGRLELAGTPSPVVEDLARYGNYDVSDSGTLAYTLMEARRTLVWVDRQGREEPIALPMQTYLYPRISPDGTRVALDVRNSRDEGDIWVLDLKRAALTRLFDGGNDKHPAWTPDGRRVVFASGRRSELIFSQAPDATGVPDTIVPAGRVQFPQSFSPDGARVILREMGTTPTGWDLNVLSLADRRIGPLVATPGTETNGEISPDGRWIAYQATGSSPMDVYVSPFPDVQKGRWRISSDGGSEPLWARSGRELFYLGLDGRLMSVRVETSPSFTHAPPTRVLNNAYLFHSVINPGRTYDVSLDGSRFLMIKEPEGGHRLVVVLNWAAALKH